MRFHRSAERLALAVAAGLIGLASTGCGSSGPEGPGTPSGLAYSANPAVYVKGTPIAPNTPHASGGTISSFSVSPALPAGLSLDPTTGVISGTPTAVAPQNGYTVKASNASGSTTATLTLTVNDVPPTGLAYPANPATYTKGTAIAPNAPSSGGGAVVSYGVSPALPAGLGLDPTTGVISGTPTEVAATASYTVTATNSGGAATATLTITVDDAAPANLAYAANPVVYTKGTAIAPNVPGNSGGVATSYAVTPALPAGLSLDSTTGVISGTPTVVTPAATYLVTASNVTGSTTVDLTITVNDVAPSSLAYGTNPAVYTKGTAITPNVPSSAGGWVISYSVAPPLPAGLSLNTATGVITGTPTAVTATASYTVTASNTGGSTSAGVSITVNDVAPTNLTYATNPAVYTRGTSIAPNAPSNGGGTVTSYSVSPALPAGLSLNTTTGVISGLPTAVTAAANYTVTGSNSGGSTTVSVRITVNDVPPGTFVYATNPAVYTKGTAITPNAPSNGGGTVTSYSVVPALPAGLSLNTTTGVISGTPTAVTPAASYTVTAANTGGSTTASLTITVNDVAPSALTYSVNPAVYTRGTAIAGNTPSNGGGTVTSYSVVPALPAGLTLNTGTGAITGTPTAVTATATYTVTATNSGGSTTVGLTITVNDVAPSALTYSTNPAVYTRGTAIAANLPGNTGGTVTAYSVAPALPAGLSLNTATGAITGTPTLVLPAASYTVTASNSGGSTTVGLTITVNDVAPSALTYSVNPAVYTKGTAIAANTPSSSGGAVVSYSVSPALPAGLGLNTTTGVITGTPTAVTATAAYTVTATNTGGSTSVGVSIRVNDVAPSALTYSSNPAVYTKGTAIATNTPSNGGGAVTSYSVAPALPAGLALNTTTGNITGTPTAVTATASYTVTASNSGGSTTVGLTLTVNDVAPSALTYSANPAVYTKGTAIATNTPSNGGGTVTSYSVAPALPAGLALNTTTGTITGTPTAVTATASYTVTASNSGGSTTVGVTITVNDVAPSALTYSSNPAVYTRGTAIATNTPSNGGGTVTVVLGRSGAARGPGPEHRPPGPSPGRRRR